MTFEYLLRERERTGARIVVVDPRRTATGEMADEWVAPRPRTDLALVLGMLHHIVSTDRHDQEFVERWVLGFDELRAHLLDQAYTVDWAAGITDVPADVIAALAEDYATRKPAAIFCTAGISHQLGAFDTYRAIAFLAAVTGNIGVPGGGCNFMHNTWPGDLHLPPLQVQTPELPSALPVGPDYFAESILTGRAVPAACDRHRGQPADVLVELDEGPQSVRAARLLRLHGTVHGGGGLLRRRHPPGLQRARARRCLHATGRPGDPLAGPRRGPGWGVPSGLGDLDRARPRPRTERHAEAGELLDRRVSPRLERTTAPSGPSSSPTRRRWVA